MHSFHSKNHQAEIVSIHTSKLSNKDVKLTNALRSVVNKLKNFIKHCFKTISIRQKSVRVNDEEIIDTSLLSLHFSELLQYN